MTRDINQFISPMVYWQNTEKDKPLPASWSSDAKRISQVDESQFKSQSTVLNQNDFIIIRRSEIAVMVRDAVAECLASGDSKVTDSATVPDQASVGDVGLKEAEVSIVIKLKAFVY